MGTTRKSPNSMGTDVPTASRSRNEDVFPAKAMFDTVENRKAERPKPEITIPVVVARYEQSQVGQIAHRQSVCVPLYQETTLLSH